MDSRARLLVVAVLLAAGGTSAILLGRGSGPSTQPNAGVFAPRATPTAPLPLECLPLPARAAMPAWFPEDLPLPGGTYANALPAGQVEGIRQIILSARASLDDVVAFVLDEWPAAGWVLGRGEREPGEAEAVFFAEDRKRYGQFRARAVYCDQGWTEVLLLLVLDGPLQPTPYGTAT